MTKSSTPPESSNDFSYLDQLDWPGAVPTGGAVRETSSEPPQPKPSSPLSLKPELLTTGPATVSSASLSTSMAATTTTTENSAQAQVDAAAMQATLRNARNQVRQLTVDLDSASRSMVDLMASHQKALRAAIRIAQTQWASDLKKARRSLQIALAVPFLTVLLLSALAAGASFAWSRHQINQADAELAQRQQEIQRMTSEFCASPPGKRACR